MSIASTINPRIEKGASNYYFIYPQLTSKNTLIEVRSISTGAQVGSTFNLEGQVLDFQAGLLLPQNYGGSGSAVSCDVFMAIDFDTSKMRVWALRASAGDLWYAADVDCN